MICSKSMVYSNVLWSVHWKVRNCGFAQVLSRATRAEIARVLKPLLLEIAPRGANFQHFERTIHQVILKSLDFQKNMLEKRFKDKIRDAFDTWLNKTPRISNNSHVTFSADEILKNSSLVHKHKYGIIQNFVVRVKRGPEATLEDVCSKYRLQKQI